MDWPLVQVINIEITLYLKSCKNEKILIALDYNPTAEKVAETGYALAKAINVTSILLDVGSDVAYYSSLDYSPIMGFGGFSNLDTVQTDTIEETKSCSNLPG